MNYEFGIMFLIFIFNMLPTFVYNQGGNAVIFKKAQFSPAIILEYPPKTLLVKQHSSENRNISFKYMGPEGVLRIFWQTSGRLLIQYPHGVTISETNKSILNFQNVQMTAEQRYDFVVFGYQIGSTKAFNGDGFFVGTDVKVAYWIPNFPVETRTVEFEENEPFELACLSNLIDFNKVFPASWPVKYTWRFKEHGLTDEIELVDIGPVAVDINGTLYISNYGSRNKGVYKCFVNDLTTVFGSTTQLSEITVNVLGNLSGAERSYTTRNIAFLRPIRVAYNTERGEHIWYRQYTFDVQYIEEDQEFEAYCIVSSKNQPVYTGWTHKSTSVTTRIPNSEKYVIKLKASYDLHERDLTSDYKFANGDVGSCIIKNLYIMRRKILVEGPKSGFVSAGSSYTLTCKFNESIKNAYAIWFVNTQMTGNSHFENVGVLHQPNTEDGLLVTRSKLTNLTKDGGNAYSNGLTMQCLFQYGRDMKMDYIAVASAYIIILEPVSIIGHPQHSTIKRKSNITLKCGVKGDHYNITWKKDNRYLTIDFFGHYTQDLEGNLIIVSDESENEGLEGNYKCEAANPTSRAVSRDAYLKFDPESVLGNEKFQAVIVSLSIIVLFVLVVGGIFFLRRRHMQKRKTTDAIRRKSTKLQLQKQITSASVTTMDTTDDSTQ